ncbi:MAG: heavy metal-binding domain-containing protein, partial [Saprospiraceae bacterium]
MKVLRSLLPILLTVLAIACKNEPKQAAATAAPAQVDQMAQKVAYLCPMDCEKGKTYDQPGQCPVCKMDLVVAGADQLRHAATEVAAAEESTELAADDPNKALETELNSLHDQT